MPRGSTAIRRRREGGCGLTLFNTDDDDDDDDNDDEEEEGGEREKRLEGREKEEEEKEPLSWSGAVSIDDCRGRYKGMGGEGGVPRGGRGAFMPSSTGEAGPITGDDDEDDEDDEDDDDGRMGARAGELF